MIFVTFHGGPGGLNNVAAYDDSGNKITEEVLQGADPDLLSELRDVRLVRGGVLWVASGGKSASAILSFQGTGTAYQYLGPIVEYPGLVSILHPFGMAFDTSDQGYVSNQDSNVVVRLNVTDFFSATPTVIAPALPSEGTFLPGTFVASSVGDLPGVPATTPVPTPAGLEVQVTGGKVVNSVRGVLWANGYLYVADEVAGAVKVYDATGAYRGEGTIAGPVHLLLNDGILYTASGDNIFWAQLDAGAPQDLTFARVPKVSIDSISGMAFGPSGQLYVASRKGQTVSILENFSYQDGPSGITEWPKKLKDEPEFLLYVANP